MISNKLQKSHLTSTQNLEVTFLFLYKILFVVFQLQTLYTERKDCMGQISHFTPTIVLCNLILFHDYKHHTTGVTLFFQYIRQSGAELAIFIYYDKKVTYIQT